MAWSSNFPAGAIATAYGSDSFMPKGPVSNSNRSESLEFFDLLSKYNTDLFDKKAAFYTSPEYRQWRQGELEDTLNFQRNQMNLAGKYKMMFDMPEKITKAFTVPAAVAATGDIAAANALATGALNTANITATAGANIGSLYSGIRPTPVQVGSTNYNLY